jgi:hypothetical protein
MIPFIKEWRKYLGKSVAVIAFPIGGRSLLKPGI